MGFLSPTLIPTPPSEEEAFSSAYSLKSLPGIVLETSIHCGQNLMGLENGESPFCWIEPQGGERDWKLASYWCFYNSHQNWATYSVKLLVLALSCTQKVVGRSDFSARKTRKIGTFLLKKKWFWKHPRSGWMGLWTSWCSGRCCSLQGVGLDDLKVLSHSNHFMIPWFLWFYNEWSRFSDFTWEQENGYSRNEFISAGFPVRAAWQFWV